MLLGALAGAWVGRAVFDWLLDVGGTLELVLIAAVAVVGAVLGVIAGLEAEQEASSAPDA